jgi:uncharacterized protein (UPF0212 family)
MNTATKRVNEWPGLLIRELLMPRSFDSDDSDAVLQFTENVDCPVCGERFEGIFYDQSGSLSVQDMTDPPTGRHECPRCGAMFVSDATGWSFFSEAG